MGGKEGFFLLIHVALFNQHLTLQPGRVVEPGCCLLGPKELGFVSTIPAGSLRGAHGAQPYKVGTYKQVCFWAFSNSRGVEDPSLLTPRATPRTPRGPCVTPSGICPSAGTRCRWVRTRQSPRQTQTPSSPPQVQGSEAKGWLRAKPGRETWAPAAAASPAPSKRCFSSFHYTGFLIKTESFFFPENEPQGPNQ